MQNDQQILGMLVNKIGSADWANWQVQRWQWYDHVRVTNTGAVTTSLTFFSIPLGGADPVSAAAKTLEQTNMVKASTFGQQYFVAQQIRTSLLSVPKARQSTTPAAATTFSFDQLVLANKLRAAFSTGVLNFTIGQKIYFDIQQPFRTCPPGFGVSQVVVPFFNTTNATGNAYVAQSNVLADVYSLTPPQLIEPEMTFQITIDFPDLGYNFASTFESAGDAATIEAGVYLDGYLARPMQ